MIHTALIKGNILGRQFFFRCQANFGRGPVAALPRPCSRPGRYARAGSPFAAPPLLDGRRPGKRIAYISYSIIQTISQSISRFENGKAPRDFPLKTNINALIKMTSQSGRRLGRPQPPRPGEPVPSVPPVGKADGAPLRYGGLRAAQAPLIHCYFIYCVCINNLNYS
jgi:hypothetical protein